MHYEYIYDSDTGREPPAYYVFSVGLVITGIFIFITSLAYLWAWNIFVGLYIPQFPSFLLALYYLGAIAWVIACPIMAMIAIFDNCTQQNIHFAAAITFFIVALVAHTLDTIGTHVAACQYVQSEPFEDRVLTFLNTSKIAKYVVLACLLVSFMIYVPIGLALVCKWEYLNQDECIAKGLGQEYCRTAPIAVPDTDSYQNSTCLYDYSGCPGVNMMRSVSQHFYVICLLSSFGITTYDLRMMYTLSSSKAETDGDDVVIN